MSFSTFSGPIRSGTQRYNPGRNTGLALLTQSLDTGVVTAGVGNVDTPLGILPQGSQIVDIAVDQTVVPGGTSTTTFSVGSTSGGAELMAAVATTAGGRFRGTATAATQLAWSLSSSADTTVYVRCVVGTDTTAAGTAAIVTITYIQQ
jgi:hypothetical protein